MTVLRFMHKSDNKLTNIDISSTFVECVKQKNRRREKCKNLVVIC